MPTRPRCVKQGDVVIAKMQLAGAICIEAFADFPQMGRFILRDEGEFQISIWTVYRSL